jgi:hypothetical protein
MVVVLICSLFVDTATVAMPTHETIYTQYHGCYPGCPGPSIPCDTLLGEWTQLCDGSWVGWGDRPWVVTCNYTVETVGESCVH